MSAEAEAAAATPVMPEGEDLTAMLDLGTKKKKKKKKVSLIFD
jgi:hypothetical protein